MQMIGFFYSNIPSLGKFWTQTVRFLILSMFFLGKEVKKKKAHMFGGLYIYQKLQVLKKEAEIPVSQKLQKELFRSKKLTIFK